MIKSVFIRNFKAYEKETIPVEEHNIIIGENDSGKSTILEALDIFFNEDKIPNRDFVRNSDSEVEIGVLINESFYKKKYKGKTYKEEVIEGDTSDLSNFQYIYMPSDTINPNKLIEDLAVAKAQEVITDDDKDRFKEIMDSGINDVLETIDNDLIVVESDGENTVISHDSKMKIESAFKYSVTSSGVPLEGRGSGYKKNVVYSLLTKGEYQNVILGIDEIDNSLSINNIQSLLQILNSKFLQTLYTTHSVKTVEASSLQMMNVVPRFKNGIETVSRLYSHLDPTNEKIIVLTEGIYDVPWIKKTLEIIKEHDQTQTEYLVLPSGSAGNIDHIKQSLEENGMTCRIIKDGDQGVSESLDKPVIEMYTPVEELNRLFDFNLSEEEIPTTKEGFFDLLTSERRNEDSVKEIISRSAPTFLTEDNPLIEEVNYLLQPQS